MHRIPLLIMTYCDINRTVWKLMLGIWVMCFYSSVGYADVYIWHDIDNIQHISNVKPDWWTDEMDQMDPDEIVAPTEEALPGAFVGDRENKKFHLPSCEQIHTPEGLMAIPDSKIIWFRALDDALSQGYFACDHCKPDNGKPSELDQAKSVDDDKSKAKKPDKEKKEKPEKPNKKKTQKPEKTKPEKPGKAKKTS